MSHLPDGQGGGGTPKPSFRVMSQKSTIHELTQVPTKTLIQDVGHQHRILAVVRHSCYVSLAGCNTHGSDLAQNACGVWKQVKHTGPSKL